MLGFPPPSFIFFLFCLWQKFQHWFNVCKAAWDLKGKVLPKHKA